MYSCLKLFASIAGLFSIGTFAWGADLAVPPRPFVPAPYSWTGLYIGLNAGYASAKVADTLAGAAVGSVSTNLTGGIGGAQFGYNYQFGNVIVGFEADFDGNMATKSFTIGGAATSGTNQIPWVGTLRGRLGYAFDRFLLYVTAGGAATQLISTINVGAIGNASTTYTHGAWTAGAGLEAAFAENFSVRVEYLYLDTGNVDVAQIGPPSVNVTGRMQDNLLRAGLNYRLPVAW